MSAKHPSSAEPVPSPGSTAVTWLLVLVVFALIVGVGYFAFYQTGREADVGKPPTVISQTQLATVPVSTPTPTPLPVGTPIPE